MNDPAPSYADFLGAKVAVHRDRGIVLHRAMIPALLKPHQADIVLWMARKGCAAVFASFGLGKTFIQLVLASLIVDAEDQTPTSSNVRALIVLPLGVRQEFTRDAASLGIPVRFVRRSDEVGGPGVYLTNYESVRDGKLDPGARSCCSRRIRCTTTSGPTSHACGP